MAGVVRSTPIQRWIGVPLAGVINKTSPDWQQKSPANAFESNCDKFVNILPKMINPKVAGNGASSPCK